MARIVRSRMGEKKLILIYLLVATITLASVGAWVLVRTYTGRLALNSHVLAERIDREQRYFDEQRQYLALLDSTHQVISAYHSEMTAVFVEADIEDQIREVRRAYTDSDSLLLFRSFDQAANFYQMMYRDKQLLASRKYNVELFTKRLEDCQLGYRKAPVAASSPLPPSTARR